MIKTMKMKQLPLFDHIFCYITLGLLCGWYYFLVILYPTLIYLIYRGSYVAGMILITFLILTIIPLRHNPWVGFMNSWLFKVWCDYFDVTADSSLQLKKDQKYMLFEFPHGIFPMGQLLSVYWIEKIFPGHMFCGTAADVVFKVPVMRHLFAWLGTRPAKRENITKILSKGHHCGVLPGGIAEMYLVNENTEELYLKSRRNTVKAAIQEGAHIIPIFFFGNTKIFHVVGQSGSDSWLARLSRRLRASIVIFYGRNYLPVPLRHPIHMVTAEIVEVKQNSNPTTEEIDDVMNRLVKSIEIMYEKKKPVWETRSLVIK